MTAPTSPTKPSRTCGGLFSCSSNVTKKKASDTDCKTQEVQQKHIEGHNRLVSTEVISLNKILKEKQSSGAATKAFEADWVKEL